jgi:hypothetical protein
LAVATAPVAGPLPTQQPQSPPPPTPSAAPATPPSSAVDPEVVEARELVGLPPLAPTGAPPADTGAPGGATTQVQPPSPRPVALTVPDIGVSQGLVDLGINADGTLEVPTDYEAVGWYADGFAPGDPGPAIMVGHVDSTEGPAVFYEVSRLVPGARIEVARADGSVVAFVVDRVQSYSKTELPTEEVYGSTGVPELRLITCGGEFDYQARSYRSNTIAFATLAAPPASAAPAPAVTGAPS